MKTITFNYTKKDNSVSERTLLVMTAPGGDKYAGIDLSEIEPAKAAQFARDVEELHNKYLADVRTLQIANDLKFAYKQFLVSGMSDVTEI